MREIEEDRTFIQPPGDSLFANFEAFWPTLVSQRPELRLPVREISREQPWQVFFTSDCAFSEPAGRVMATAILSWVEPTRREGQNRPMRFDLTVHTRGFEQNLYSSLYPIENLQRFNIPSNSRMVENTDVTLVTGMTQFPRLLEFKTEQLVRTIPPTGPEQGETRVPYTKYYLTIGDLASAISYTVRRCEFVDNVWLANGQYVFSTPVCKDKF